MANTYRVGIKAGAVSGIITGILFSIILSVLFYATMSDTSSSLDLSEKTIAELSGFGKTQGNTSMISAILTIIATTFGISLLAGILLGAATSAMNVITRRGTSFSISVLIMLALAVYYYQKYDMLANVLKYVSSDKYVSENIKILIVLTNTMPPLIFAAVEAMLLNYFWGNYTVVNFLPQKPVKKEIPIPTNPVNATYSANAPVQATQKQSPTQLLVKSLQASPRPPPAQPASRPVQNDIPDDLKAYICECMDNGLSEGEIKSMFIGYGYNSEAIDRVITEKKSGPDINA